MLKRFVRQINVLNIILFLAIAAICAAIILPVFITDILDPVKVQPQPDPPRSEPPPPEVAPPLQDYAVVAEKNLFHPGRILPPRNKEAEIPRPEFILYGTLISDPVRIAYLADNKAPRSTPGRGARQTGLKLGGTMSGYTLKEVLHDRVVMVRGDDRIEVMVIAPGHKKGRGGEAGGPRGSAVATPGHVRPAVPAPPLPPAKAPFIQPPGPQQPVQRPMPRQPRTMPSPR